MTRKFVKRSKFFVLYCLLLLIARKSRGIQFPWFTFEVYGAECVPGTPSSLSKNKIHFQHRSGLRVGLISYLIKGSRSDFALHRWPDMRGRLRTAAGFAAHRGVFFVQADCTSKLYLLMMSGAARTQPLTQKCSCWPSPTRTCHTGQRIRKCNGRASP